MYTKINGSAVPPFNISSTDPGRFFFSFNADAVYRNFEPPTSLRLFDGLIAGFFQCACNCPAGGVNGGQIGRFVKLDHRFFFHFAERHRTHSPSQVISPEPIMRSHFLIFILPRCVPFATHSHDKFLYPFFDMILQNLLLILIKMTNFVRKAANSPRPLAEVSLFLPGYRPGKNET
jgi:hypothetical protein